MKTVDKTVKTFPSRRQRLTDWLRRYRLDLLLVIGLLILAGVAHAWNMFHYPYYESDEGTYMSQAWAVLTEGRLANYTYWYDHAPGGWIFIALWLKLTGGLFTFGFSINSGRVFMLILHLFSVVFLYLVARKLSGNRAVAVLTVLFFSLTPLGIYFQRRVLLDNIMVFWTLLSLVFLLYSGNRLRNIVLSAITFGIAVLSKESAIFFIPLFLIVIFTQAHKRHRNFAVYQWLGLMLSVVSLYFLYAFIKGEFFPTGSMLGGSKPHVSLLGTLEFQGSRGSIPIWHSSNSFWSVSHRWIKDDPLIIFGGAAATLMLLLVGIKKRGALLAGILAACYWAFLLRGGLVLEFYVIPLIPVCALAMAYVVHELYLGLRRVLPRFLKPLTILPYAGAAAVLAAMVFGYSMHFRHGQNIYTSDQTSAQVAAVNWILNQKHPNAFYAIDNYAYLDLNLHNNGDFKRADYYWKVDQDRDVRDTVIHDNPDNIDYVAFTPLIGGDLGTGELPLVGKALETASPLKSFTGDGWYVQIWGVKNTRRILDVSWQDYKKTFVAKGQVTDPEKQVTTSDEQADTMLRAVEANDRATFDQTYTWTKQHLGRSDGLFNLKAGDDSRTSSGADTTTAMALAEAAQQWHNTDYLTQAKALAAEIYTYDVTDVNGQPTMTAGAWAAGETSVTINPSYLMPAAYKLFATIDATHDWAAVSSSSYSALTACTTADFGSGAGVLPPDWCALDRANGAASQSQLDGTTSTTYSPQAATTLTNVALDYTWNKDPRAKAYMDGLVFLAQQWQQGKTFYNAYTHDGQVLEHYESVAADSADLAYFMVENPTVAKDIYSTKVLAHYYEGADSAYWEDQKNYQAQTSAWVMTNLYSGRLQPIVKVAK